MFLLFLMFIGSFILGGYIVSEIQKDGRGKSVLDDYEQGGFI